MARPREFDESTVLDAAVQCFWSRGYEATSIRDLIKSTGITGPSLYNAFGDKRSLYKRALDHYVEESIGDRIQRCAKQTPVDGIWTFFDEIVHRSLTDKGRKGCMLVNTSLEVAPHDPELRKAVAQVMSRIEIFFLSRIEAGQADGSIRCTVPAPRLAHHLLAVLMGIRVLARVRPERTLLKDAVASALTLLNLSTLSTLR